MTHEIQQQEEETQGRLPRVVVDFKIPLPWLLGGVGAISWGLISMWFKLTTLSDNVTELQIAVKAGTATTIQYASEQTLIKYRLEKLEARGESRGDRK